MGNELAYSERHQYRSGEIHELRTKSTYDDRERIIGSERTLDGEELKSVQYEYDKLGRLCKKSGKEGDVVECLSESTERNLLGWITGVKTKCSGKLLFDNQIDYRYDGLVSEVSFNHNLFGSSDTKRVRNEYDYDHLGRFIGNRRFVNGVQTSVGTERDIMYDLNGNLEFVRRNVDGTSVEYGFVYNGNTLELIYRDPFSDMVEMQFVSDENGNLIQNGYWSEHIV